MKKARDYIEDEVLKLHESEQPYLDVYVYDGSIDPIHMAIQQAQEDAIKATLKLAAEKAASGYIDLNGDKVSVIDHMVDKDSILSLEDELIKTINNG